jgi:cobalt-precorrin-6B (C15)-methyltransferase
LSWDYVTSGIPDDLFERADDIPITKEEVRAIVLGKLRLKSNYSVIDVGCGSGSITVELCLKIKTGKVYAIDFNPKAIELTRRNLNKFGLDAELIPSLAQETLPVLPGVDAIIVGGTWGETEKIIELCVTKLKPGGRIVVDTILIETMYKAITTIKKLCLSDIDVTQILITKGKNVSTGTMLTARNPVLVISGTK